MTRKRMTFRVFVYALYALTRAAQRDTAMFVLTNAVPMWVRRLGGHRGPYMRLARRLQRRWWGPLDRAQLADTVAAALRDAGLYDRAAGVVFFPDEWDDGIHVSPHGIVFLLDGRERPVDFVAAAGLLGRIYGQVPATFHVGVRPGAGGRMEIVDGPDPAAFWQAMRINRRPEAER